MIDAKVLATSDSDATVDVWGVWVPRRGDNVIFTVDVAANYGTDFTVELFQKNYDETGDGTDALVGVNYPQSTGRKSFTMLGAKELVRVKLTLIRGGALPPADIGLILFRFLQPVWYEAV